MWAPAGTSTSRNNKEVKSTLIQGDEVLWRRPPSAASGGKYVLCADSGADKKVDGRQAMVGELHQGSQGNCYMLGTVAACVNYIGIEKTKEMFNYD